MTMVALMNIFTRCVLNKKNNSRCAVFITFVHPYANACSYVQKHKQGRYDIFQNTLHQGQKYDVFLIINHFIEFGRYVRTFYKVVQA